MLAVEAVTPLYIRRQQNHRKLTTCSYCPDNSDPSLRFFCPASGQLLTVGAATR